MPPVRVGRGLAVAALLFGAMAAGCAPSFRTLHEEIEQEGAGAYVEGVPFVRQRGSWCGPAALASVAQHNGLPLSQEQIAREVYLPSIGATVTLDLQACAAQHGLWCHAGRGSADEVRAWLDRGVPVIALLRLGSLAGRRYHYVVVLGHHRPRGYFIAHMGLLPHQPISFRDFARMSERGGGWLLVACPPDRVTWPLTADGHNDLGVAFEKAGAWDRARDAYGRAASADPSKALYRFNSGNVLARLGQKSEAEQAYREAIRLTPDFADAHNNLACLLLDLPRPEDARREAEAAVAIGGARLASYLDTLGQAQMALGRLPEAAETFRRAIADAKADPALAAEARLGLIEALVKAGQREAAAAEKERLAAVTQDESLLRRAEQLLK